MSGLLGPLSSEHGVLFLSSPFIIHVILIILCPRPHLPSPFRFRDFIANRLDSVPSTRVNFVRLPDSSRVPRRTLVQNVVLPANANANANNANQAGILQRIGIVDLWEKVTDLVDLDSTWVRVGAIGLIFVLGMI